MSKNRYILVLIFFYAANIFSQNTDLIVKEFIVDNGDTLLVSNIPSIQIISFKNTEERVKYYHLKRKVLKVYPYAIYARDKLLEVDSNLADINKKRKKKKYVKKVSDFLKKELANELKNLTRTEGNILVKLIYRETNISTYSLLKEYRGSINAFFWQTIAKAYDNNLRQTYDPLNNREDMFIEHIIVNAKMDGEL